MSLRLCFSGNYFFVDSENGDDNNEGSYEKPWKSLQTVINEKIETYSDTGEIVNEGAPIKSGDVIILLEGDYGKIRIENLYNSDYIIIAANEESKAKLSYIAAKNTKYWRFDGLFIVADQESNYPMISMDRIIK